MEGYGNAPQLQFPLAHCLSVWRDHCVFLPYLASQESGVRRAGRSACQSFVESSWRIFTTLWSLPWDLLMCPLILAGSIIGPWAI